MSQLRRSELFQGLVVGAVCVGVFLVALYVPMHQVISFKNHLGTTLPARVVEAAEPKNSGIFGILGIFGEKTTKVSLEVTAMDGTQSNYQDVELEGELVQGQGLHAWYVDGDSNGAYFEGGATEYNNGGGAPWGSMTMNWLFYIFFALAIAGMAGVMTYALIAPSSPIKKLLGVGVAIPAQKKKPAAKKKAAKKKPAAKKKAPAK